MKENVFQNTSLNYRNTVFAAVKIYSNSGRRGRIADFCIAQRYEYILILCNFVFRGGN